MAISKVVYNSNTLIDLTSDTAVESDVLVGKTFHKADGSSAVGTASGGITPSGTISITQNGTHDVTNYASADVNVSGGIIPTQNKFIIAEYPYSPVYFNDNVIIRNLDFSGNTDYGGLQFNDNVWFNCTPTIEHPPRYFFANWSVYGIVFVLSTWNEYWFEALGEKCFHVMYMDTNPFEEIIEEE